MWRSRCRRADAPATRRPVTAAVVLSLALLNPARAADRLTLGLAVNGLDTGQVVDAWRLPEGLAVRSADLAAWRVRIAPDAVRWHDGQEVALLSRIPGLSHELEASRQMLALEVAPASFATHRASADDARLPLKITPALGGSFVNYDISAGQGTRRGVSGVLEAGVFNGAGSGTATAAYAPQPDGSRRLLRLDTQWTAHFPEAMRSLRVGDSVTQPGSWGRAVRFAGLQWASNFALRPGFVPYALPSVRGEAALPSTLDVYVDNVRRLQMPVPAGPFDLSQVPVVTGQGDMRVVVRDVLGREQVIVAPYLVTPQLLRGGLEEISYEAGWVRRDYGLRSDAYGPFMASATRRHGVSDTLTREWRAELSADRQALGGSSTVAWGEGTAALGGAVSHARDRGAGALLQADAERRLGPVSVHGRASWASAGFSQLGQSATAERQTFAVSAAVPLGGQALGATLTRRTSWDGQRDTVLSGSWSRQLGAVSMSVFAMRDLSRRGGASAGFMLSWQFDGRTSVSAEFASQGGKPSAQLSLQRPSVNDGDVALRAATVDPGGAQRWQAGAEWQSPWAALTAEAAGARGTSGATRVGARGGIAMAGGEWYAGRALDGSFAVVDAGAPDVRVYRDNREVGRTGANGRTVVTGLRAWEPHQIAIEPDDLPMDARATTEKMTVTPPARSGVAASFPVMAERGIAFHAVDESGRPLPPGTLLVAGGVASPVGLEGRAALHPYRAGEPVTSVAGGRACVLALPITLPAGALPELGPVVCRPMTPS